MRRTKGTGTIQVMHSGKYKYRGLIDVGVNKNGNKKQKCFYGNTKKEVEEKIKAFYSQDNPKVLSRVTLNDGLDLLYHESLENGNKMKSMSIIETTSKILRKYWGSFSLEKIYRNDVKEKFALFKQQYSFSQVQKIRNYGRKAFDLACREYDLNLTNPFCLPLKKDDSISPKEDNYFTEEEIYRINYELRTSVYCDLVFFLYWTGLRINECLALTYGDVDFDDRRIHICKTLSETKQLDGKYRISVTSPKTMLSYRWVPLRSEAYDILIWKSQGRRPEELVFCTNKGTFLSARNVLRSFNNAMAKAGISKNGRSLHSIRHSTIIRLFQEASVDHRLGEIDAIDISKIMGHRVDVSAYLYDTEQKERANRIREAWEEHRIEAMKEPIRNWDEIIEMVLVEFSQSTTDDAIESGLISYNEKSNYEKFCYQCHALTLKENDPSFPILAGKLCSRKDLWQTFRKTGELDFSIIEPMLRR